MNAKVAIVDLDLRRPMVHTLFGYNKENGVTDILNDDKPVGEIMDDYVKKSLIKNLDVITSGFIPPNPSELLSGKRMLEFMHELRERYDYILYDAPPVIAVTDTLIIAKHTDMLLLVARVELAEKLVIKRIKEIFDHLNIDITGVIINGIRPHRYYSSYEYNYYYYYYYGTTKQKKKKNSKKSLR
jgi:tyrosine-protein kinase Etk/Wzc